jgi:hypothetical protein
MACEKVFMSRAPANGCKSGSGFAFDPASGALVVSPDLDLKIRKAILAEARSIQLRLYFSLLSLYFRKLTLQVRYTNLRIARNFSSYLSDFRRDSHIEVLASQASSTRFGRWSGMVRVCRESRSVSSTIEHCLIQRSPLRKARTHGTPSAGVTGAPSRRYP